MQRRTLASQIAALISLDEELSRSTPAANISIRTDILLRSSFRTDSHYNLRAFMYNEAFF